VSSRANSQGSETKKGLFLAQALTMMGKRITGTKEPTTFFSLIFDFVSFITSHQTSIGKAKPLIIYFYIEF
jgi:hypothetical protein